MSLIRIEAVGQDKLAPHVLATITAHVRERWDLTCRNCKETPSYTLHAVANVEFTNEPGAVLGGDDARAAAVLACTGCGELRWLDLAHAGIDAFAEAPVAPPASGPYR